MSSTEIKTLSVAKKQYDYKLKCSMGLFLSMLAIQLLALLISLRGVGVTSMGSGNIAFAIRYYSADILVVFTFLWILLVSIMLTTKENRNMDFDFVSNRLSSNLANIALLFTAAIVGGLTVVLGGVLLRVIVYFYLGSAKILSINFFVAPVELLITFAMTALFLLLLSAIAYFCGMMAQLSKTLLIILPALIFLIARSDLIHTVSSAINFFIRESSLPLLAFKAIFMTVLFFGSSIVLSNRLEVR